MTIQVAISSPNLKIPMMVSATGHGHGRGLRSSNISIPAGNASFHHFCRCVRSSGVSPRNGCVGKVVTGRVLDDSGTPEPPPGRRRCRLEPISALRPVVRCMPQIPSPDLYQTGAIHWASKLRARGVRSKPKCGTLHGGAIVFASSVTACDSPCAPLTSRDTLERRDRYQPWSRARLCGGRREYSRVQRRSELSQRHSNRPRTGTRKSSASFQG